ncbi:hypothetical protein AAE478_007915 [Parahypoxylon ruwenzoriense]
MAGTGSDSSINASGQHESGTSFSEPTQSHKRIRACVTCRNMKIKCVSVPGSKDCENCLRFSRPCQDPGPPKARIKTSQKFSELEKKIDALTTALDSERRRNKQSLGQITTEEQWSRTPDSNIRDNDDLSPRRQDRDLESAIDNARVDTATSGDAIGQGLIDMPTAVLLFNHWNLRMRPLMPVVWFPPEEDVYILRTAKPTLLLVIMTVASTSIRPSLVPRLLARLNETLAQEVFIQGARSLDLLQAMILFSQYYIQPPHIKTFALPHHIYSAVVMSHDLALDDILKRNEKGNERKTEEACRTLLAVYFGASSAATLLRRHQPPVSSSSNRGCTEALLIRTDNRQRDDEWLCSLATLQELFEDVSKTLNVSYARTDEFFDDFGTQHLLSVFRQRLADWTQSPSGAVDRQLKIYAASIADLYIHQVAIRVYLRQMQAWFKSNEQHGSSQSPPSLTAMHTDALCHCLKVSAGALDIYLSLDDATTRCLPNIFLIWNMCAVVCLIKLSHFAQSLSHDGIGGDGGNRADPPSPLNFLEAMIQKLTRLSQNGYFPQSRPFLIAFRKLQIWHLQRKTICINNRGDCDDGSNGPVHDILGTQTPPASPLASNMHITPSQAQADSQKRLSGRLGTQYEPNGSTTIPEIYQTHPQSLDWGPSPHSLVHTETEGATEMNTAFDIGYDADYLSTDIGNIGFDFNDMREFDNFMMQTDDGGLWSLL